MIPFSLAAWAQRHHVSDAAMAELRMGALATLDPPSPPGPAGQTSEEYVKSEVRLEAAQQGVRLFRNNVGAMQDDTGRVIRFGLANDSAQLNARLKSSDLIGWRPRLITPADVGKLIAQFVARECKRKGWKFNENDDREAAQATFIHLVQSEGGDGAFTMGPGSL